MGDMGDYWNDIKAARKEESADRRAHNRERSLELLREHGVRCQVKNEGAHLIVTAGKLAVDFWPGTGKWIVRGDVQRKEGRGVHNLLKRINAELPL